MKIKTFLIGMSCWLCALAAHGQRGLEEVKYRRSSLSMILIENNFPNKNAVMKSWNNYPFPDKYNHHDIAVKTVNLGNLKLSNQKGDTVTAAPNAKAEQDIYTRKINQVIKEQKIAHQLVGRWFNRSAQQGFDMQLIQERGYYNATELEASIAKQEARGLAALADAGEELISNTFVTFTQFTFYANEPVARIIRDVAIITAKNTISKEFALNLTIMAANAAYAVAKDGYSLWSKTWLYKLVWNDSIANVFYTQYYPLPTDDAWAVDDKLSAFEASDIFQLALVGVQYNQSLVTGSLLESRSTERLIDIAEVRNLDNVFAQLQRDHDVFKPKVPIWTTHPITAQIGMKEGLKGGEKFEVLEMTQDPQTERTKYVRVGTAKVNKKQLWDNRYNVAEEGKTLVPATDKEGNPIVSTMFSGPKKAQPGMLLRQIK
ncbi:hypothetical protein FACS1894156_4030 [Bacteroidia bacterium]|nr:hypothetical protein FACS1894156_4030 [Bacteroidia bacterium]